MTTEPGQPSGADWQIAMGQVNAAMGMMESTSVWREQAGLYKSQLVDNQQFSVGAAEAMAVQYHQMIMTIITNEFLASKAKEGAGA